MENDRFPVYPIKKGLAYYFYWDEEAGIDRPAAQVEMEMMKEALKSRNFDVEVLRNLTKAQIEDELEKIRHRDDMVDYDALWILVVSLRATNDRFVGKDGEEFLARRMVEHFVKKEYRNLDGKPKMFLFQAALPEELSYDVDHWGYIKNPEAGFPIGDDIIIIDSSVRAANEAAHHRYHYLELFSTFFQHRLGSGYFYKAFQWVNSMIENEFRMPFNVGKTMPKIPEYISTMTKDVIFYKDGVLDRSVHYTSPPFLKTAERPTYCSIFNYYNYGTGSDREGSRKDVENIKNAMKRPGIQVLDDEEDLPLEQLREKLKQVFNRGDEGAVNIVFLMSHGEGNTMVLPNEEEFPLKELNDLFPEHSIVNIVIIQMCRIAPEESSEPTESSSKCDVLQLHTTHEDDAETFPIARSNVMIFWSTYYGDPSLRHYKDGSFFIQDLCRSINEMSDNGKLEPFVEICILTNHYMRQRTFTRRLRKMIPVFNSTLTNCSWVSNGWNVKISID